MEKSVSSIVKLIEEHYNKPNNTVGGVLHIVTDDGNVSKSHIKYVLKEAKKVNDTLAISIAEEILKLDIKSRRKLIEAWDNYRYTNSKKRHNPL